MTAQDRLVWFKGALVAADAAQVSILSPTAQFGLNVFESIRGYWSEEAATLSLFRLTDHLARLFDSCRLIGIEPPHDAPAITEAITSTLRANDYRCDVSVRVMIFVEGEGSWSVSAPVGMVVAPIARPRRDVAAPGGLRGHVSSWERIDDRAMPPRVKAGANYINGRYAHLEAAAAGYDLPILLDRAGKVSEGAGACLMMVRGGVLTTPPATASILESITRDTLLTLAREVGQAVEIRVIDRTELYVADEAFICGTAAEVTPLLSIDRFRLGEGVAGPVTRRLLSAYLEAATGEGASGRASAHADWLTPV